MTKVKPHNAIVFSWWVHISHQEKVIAPNTGLKIQKSNLNTEDLIPNS